MTDMLLAAFSLKRVPFHKSIPTDKLFSNKQYIEMKARIELLIQNRGIGLFTGEVGAGKSTMVRLIAQNLNPQLHLCIYLCKGIHRPFSFYKQIAYGLNIQPAHLFDDVQQQVQNQIHEIFTQQKISVFIIIDEAHLLNAEILDEIRLLHNAEFDSKDYLTTLLLGQPPLRKMMAYVKFTPLAQRIAVSYHLEALSKDDAYKYFEHQLKTAGAHSKVFLDNAIEATIQAAKGIPRVINNIALKAMYAALQNKMTTVDQECVMIALDELGLK